MFLCHLRTCKRLRPASGFSAISTLPNEHLRGFAPDFERAWRPGAPVSPSKSSSSPRACGGHRVYCRILSKRTRAHTERPQAQALPGRLEPPILRLTASRSSQQLLSELSWLKRSANSREVHGSSLCGSIVAHLRAPCTSLCVSARSDWQKASRNFPQARVLRQRLARRRKGAWRSGAAPARRAGGPGLRPEPEPEPQA